MLQNRVSAWEQHTLDTIRFLPMADKGAFGFVDPTDVLRGCHIIPSFADGRLHPDNVAMSRCAGDSDDWKCISKTALPCTEFAQACIESQTLQEGTYQYRAW